jgi:hypothetical protein
MREMQRKAEENKRGFGIKIGSNLKRVFSEKDVDFNGQPHYNVKSRQGNHLVDHEYYLLFRSSSVVELSAVNRSVVGSSPTCGANFMGKYSSG